MGRRWLWIVLVVRVQYLDTKGCCGFVGRVISDFPLLPWVVELAACPEANDPR